MKIQKEELVLVPFRETAYCEKCGVEMTRRLCRQEGYQRVENGTTSIGTKDIYEYTCPKCGAKEESEIKFPRISYKYKEANKIGFERLFNFQP